MFLIQKRLNVKNNILKITALVLVLIFVVPAHSIGNEKLEELKRLESESQGKVDLLYKDIQVKEDIFIEVTNQVEGIQNNIISLENQIKNDEAKIAELTTALSQKQLAIIDVKVGLAETMRELDSVEQTHLLASFFNHDNLSDALADIEQRRALTEKISSQYNSLIETTHSLAAVRDQMELAKLELASSRVTLDLQHQALKVEQNQQKEVLDSSKSQLKSVQTELNEIRRQIFALAGDNSGRSITFDEAVQYAKLASDRIYEVYRERLSVPLLLALVRHESNFGNYLGRGTYHNSMCSQKQVEAFLQITASLHMDPETTMVSKPARNQSCGGAMGYGQFLPITWLGFSAKVSQITGHNPASPWNPEDAFTAVALKLTADGATDGATPAQKRRKQWEALMTYFSGSKWKNPSVLKNIRWYADNILRTADGYNSLIGS